ncbi:MAG: hypothetical protein CSA10_00545, partial [Cardiobacteriales bacterium]
MELGNQVLIEVRKEMSGNMVKIKSLFSDWIDRPESSSLAELSETMKEVSGGLSLLGFNQAAKLAVVITNSIFKLNENIKNINKKNLTASIAEVADALLVLENFIKQIDSTNNLDIGSIQRSYEILESTNQSLADFAGLDTAPKVDNQTYHLIAENITEQLVKVRQKIEQCQKSGGQSEIIADIVALNDDLGQLFATLN